MWGTMCAMLLTSFGWDLRNVAENDQGTTNCELLQFFFKNCRNDSNGNFGSHFTRNGGPLCLMTLIV